MSLPLNVALVVVLLIPLWVLLRRDFIKGLAYGVFVCVSMPTYLRIQVPGNLPQLTIYRLVLIIVFFFWLRNRSRVHRLSAVPLFGAFCFWALADLASLLLTSGDAVVGLKRYLDFVLETAVFFLVLVTSLRQREQALRILRAACLGATLVATLAFVEKYTGTIRSSTSSSRLRRIRTRRSTWRLPEISSRAINTAFCSAPAWPWRSRRFLP